MCHLVLGQLFCTLNVVELMVLINAGEGKISLKILRHKIFYFLDFLDILTVEPGLREHLNIFNQIYRN